MAGDLVKRALYRSGLLGLYHRLRNRRALTVIMFHRVLTQDDPRWAACDPDYTLEAGLFERCLDFFRRHYNVVSVDQVLAARRHGAPLPDRPLLITFDDGWADNHAHALPRLRAAGLPALLFTVADVVDRDEPFFQERLIAAYRRNALRVPALAQVLAEAGHPLEPAPPDTLAGLRKIIAALEALDTAQRSAVLAPLAAAMDDGVRQMVTRGELRELAEGGISIGVHGKTHTPMTCAEDLEAELATARAIVGGHLDAAPPPTMSYPHGRYDEKVLERTRAAGYELAFTSNPVMNPVAARPSWLLGRLGFEQDGIVDGKGRFRPDWLGLYLFRAPAKRLSA
ncbi:polysaccharide deacetylase family protein [Luteimonas saliphila]|uniref:polysaccharide deacetylase family protein n=1 Tax=Luteimonas saliphila TaxID=2804919 RepID=UPI00192D5E39|nr:polysaccharide deacetylase family protein [Luteimonas saliphila]